mmetsp:Transcript_61922/g.136131  ORF Transcript_61922/g.136131 Transcript_61922/m.136131 type:complete len:269 (-) Transcript_61922:508-1314(-)
MTNTGMIHAKANICHLNEACDNRACANIRHLNDARLMRICANISHLDDAHVVHTRANTSNLTDGRAMRACANNSNLNDAYAISARASINHLTDDCVIRIHADINYLNDARAIRTSASISHLNDARVIRAHANISHLIDAHVIYAHACKSGSSAKFLRYCTFWGPGPLPSGLPRGSSSSWRLDSLDLNHLALALANIRRCPFSTHLIDGCRLRPKVRLLALGPHAFPLAKPRPRVAGTSLRNAHLFDARGTGTSTAFGRRSLNNGFRLC